ncbi:hypothetical protein LSAT2_006492 [Lamellibrachia satsuma]|nr:hypothetical protein LSAT2_006492 [Lamellibrachia satsuma]
MKTRARRRMYNVLFRNFLQSRLVHPSPPLTPHNLLQILILCALLLDVPFCSCDKVSARHAKCNRWCLNDFWGCFSCPFDKYGLKHDRCRRELNECLNECTKRWRNPSSRKRKFIVTRQNGENGDCIVTRDATQPLETLQDVHRRKPREMREDCR